MKKRMGVMTLQLRRPKKPTRTSVSFSAEELTQLGHLLAAGLVLSQPKAKPVVLARLKAAMTRLKVSVPHGM